LAGLELVGQEGVHVGDGYMSVVSLLAGTEGNAIVGGTDGSYVAGLGVGDCESAALAEGVIEDALVLAEDFTVGIKDRAWTSSSVFAEGVSVVALAGETQLHGVGAVGNF